VLLPAVSDSFKQLSAGDVSRSPSIAYLMEMLSTAIGKLEKQEIASCEGVLISFFMGALGYRSAHKQMALPAVRDVERQIINPFMSLVLKVPESTFRKIIHQVFLWATTSDGHPERIIVFYHLADCLAEQLKSLFSLFIGYFVRNAAQLLQQNTDSTPDDHLFGPSQVDMTCQLLEFILSCFKTCFLYDKQKCINTDLFNVLMKPLVNQLENSLGGEAVYEERVRSLVIPCIAQFSLSVSDEALYKTLNYEICLKTKHPSVQVRRSALTAILELARKLESNYLPIVLQTIPFLSEAMEDDVFEIEALCQSVTAELEEILGEPLQKHM
jgi:U3 small nucleolar RNA-associated protein 10